MGSIIKSRTVSTSLCLALILSACGDGVSMNSPSRQMSKTSTEMQKAIGGCIASVAFGAILGKAITGENEGAAIGAAIGGANCLVLVQVANEKDKARIAAEEQRSIQTNKSRTKRIKTESGKVAVINTKVSKAQVPPSFAPVKKATASNVKTCRMAQQEVVIDGHSAKTEPQIWCRVDGGDWQPYK